MKIKLSYTSESDIPEGFDALYAERDGAWVLTGVEGMKTQGDVDAVREGLVKERNEHKETKARLKLFGDHSPEEYDTLVQEYAELKITAADGGKMDDEKVAQLVEAKLRPVQKSLDVMTAERDEALASAGQVTKQLVQSGRRDEVFAAIGKKEGVRKDSSSAILKFAGDDLVYDEDAKEFRTEAGLTTSEWLDAFCDTNAYVMEATKGGGAGGGGADKGGASCFKSGNVTDQMRLKKSDPVAYARLKKAYEASK